MLNRISRTDRPDWANPYEPTWYGNQWIVVFPSQKDAMIGCRIMQRGQTVPLDFDHMPDGSNLWYVGVVDN